MRIEQLASDDPRVAAVYDEVLAPAFTAEELISVGELVDLVAVGASRLFVAFDGGRPVGAAVVEGAADEDVHLLGYLASRADGRSRGVGSALMRHLLDAWAAPGGPALVLAEVHDPERWATTEEERPLDRMRFYARLGARRLPFEWVQPSLGPGLDPVRGMCLIVLHARPPALVPARGAVEGIDGAAAEGIDGRMLGDWIEACHGATDDPELAGVRAAASAAGPVVALVPPSGSR
ncbi:MAG: GNAT family N-acetyltransferase [Acidimicrobiales bacterium]|nr:GNAT family N-acetyltransferase [Acidimicrobiales bacterium]